MHVGFHDLQEHFHESSNHDRGTLWELAIVRRERADVPERRSSVGRLRHPVAQTVRRRIQELGIRRQRRSRGHDPQLSPNHRQALSCQPGCRGFRVPLRKDDRLWLWVDRLEVHVRLCRNASASYIKVDSDPNGPGIDLSEPGDSGGPWYEQNVALGTMSCQQGNDAIYMASDYIETGLSATILTSP